jgi:DNA repair protein RadC
MERMPLKSWAEADRPREKLLEKGIDSLSDAELIAILIGSGNKNETAVELGRRILNAYQNDIVALTRLTVSDFSKFNGIGTAKAISIVAAIELGRRSRKISGDKKTKLISSKDAADYFRIELGDKVHEEFWVLLLNRSNQVIYKGKISSGGVAGTVVDSKMIFKLATDKLASAVILCHNHPSGNCIPSEADIRLTRKLKEAGNVLDITVLDHIIVTANEYYSFADQNQM